MTSGNRVQTRAGQGLQGPLPTISIKHGTRVKVEVTQEAIDEAIRESTTECAVSCALEDQGFSRPMTDLQSVRFTDRAKGVRYIYFTPKIVQDFLVDFDGGRPVKPFAFTLYRPAQILPQGASNGPPKLRRSAHRAPIKIGGRAPKSGKQVRVYGMRAFRVNQGDLDE